MNLKCNEKIIGSIQNVVLIFCVKKKLQLNRWLGFLLLISIFGCTEKTTYSVVGTITDIQIKEKTVIVRHDSIPGLMMAMTMPFQVKNLKEIEHLSNGDSIHFDFIWMDGSTYIEKINVVGKGNGFEEDNEDNFWEEESFQKSLGDIIDNGSFLNDSGGLVQLSESDGKFRIISFIFSRCPMPNLCPAIVFKNQYLASVFKDNNQVELIMISFDYEYDSPKILMEKYGPAISQFPQWHIWSSQNHSSDITWLAKQTGFEFWGVEQNQIGHNLRTIILDPKRRWIKTYVGDQWRGKDIKNDLNQIMRIYK
ncbi:MAG: hypothetical protein HOD28_07440 [Candidatus Marinimicrobia bacterium]|jgi:protein SCO1/2|nr:hypothetical protein [Candidatus Neomarinimicrobiota bacterium]MBT3936389.1 hypothetical protein [Candidatus Neomarinimicrobiota bacterium]MBT4383429.1 hypothetical protein [Candidatus Neomarinimicrobiota bacterium]MBT4635441.1 hypothetical protein [Candidatus Neomarinimicrobiota bacterium]MBT4735176.1 hypothetical protein [Candidatus Neomarinimicrobiota bacterium]